MKEEVNYFCGETQKQIERHCIDTDTYKYSLSAPETNWGYLNVATLATLMAQNIATFATFRTQDVAMPKKRRLD